MKAQILKIAGVKSEKEFYKKYPSEKAFMKQHGKAFKKAQIGAMMDNNNNGIPDAVENPNNTSALGAPGFGQTANYADTLGYQSQPSYLPKPPMPVDDNYTPMVEGYPRQSFTDAEIAKQNEQIIDPSTNEKQKGPGFNMTGAANVVTGTKEGLDALTAEQKLTDKMRTWANVSDVIKEAGISNAYLQKEPNKWLRADDPRFTHNIGELYRPQGRGSDVISQNGSSIGGNPTEIQNTYSDGVTLYDDLGYAPLDADEYNNDANNVKAFQGGGGFGSWFGQATNSLGGDSAKGFMGNMGGGSPFDSMIGGAFGNNAGSKIGGSIGSVFGPVGSLVGTAIGGYADKEGGKQAFAQSRINSNQSFLNRLSATGGIHNQFSQVTQNGGDLAMYEEGGYMNPEYNPQVIAMFGDHNAQDFADYAHKDVARAGGHLKEYTAPSNRAMETFALGGKLQSHWGGNVEDISYNRYMPGSGKTAMINGPSHNNDGVGISYGNPQNGYNEGYAANGAEMKAQIEGEGGEPVIEMAEGGNINPQTGEQETSAVVAGNIPVSLDMAKLTENPDLIRIATDNPNHTFKKIIASYSNGENKANKLKEQAADISNEADKTKWGKLDEQTAFIKDKSGDMELKRIAKDKMLLANYQNVLHKIKDEISQAKGKNISAEALGKGLIEIDKDPITKNAPLTQTAKFGASLMKAQNSATITPTDEAPRLTQEQYNKLVSLYEQGKKDKKSPAIKEFQHLYHQFFPKEAVEAIQKTTKERGVTSKGKQMGLTKEDILSGKDTGRILESNEDEFFGPRTIQYMSNINTDFNKTPPTKDLQLKGLGTPSTTGETSTKSPIDVVPYKGNRIGEIAGLVSSLFQNNRLPGIDPRQFAKEYLAMATNAVEPVQSQRLQQQLDPLYRVSYEDIRNQTTADFREAERQLAGNPAALASLYSKKFMANQPGYAEEFRTNQAIEDKIFGGNRAKINQTAAANIQLDAAQRDLQEKAKSITKETQREAIGSIADKTLQHEARNLEYNIKSNLFPKFGYDPSGKIHTQGPWFQPNIPQVYGSNATLSQVPIYGADGKITGYQLQPYDPNATTTDTTTLASYATPGVVAAKKNGGSVVKNAKNSSVVKAYKNL